MPAKPGKNARLYVSGAAVSFTDEACTTLVANTTYQITNTAKRIWDRSIAITVKKDAVSQASTLYTLNRLTGTVTFNSDIGGGHTITVSGSYLPTSQAAQAKSYDYSITAGLIPVAKFGDVYIPRLTGLYDIKGSLSGWKIDTYYSAALIAGVPVVLEFWSDSTLAYDVRSWALLNRQQVQAAIDGAISESVSFEGATDVDLRSISG
jgi:hypothetical protein